MGRKQGAVRPPIPLHILLPIPAPIPYSLALPFISHSGSHSSHSQFFCAKFSPSDSPLATTHTFLERSREDLSGNIWIVALIVYRFRDKRQEHQHRRLNSYLGNYNYSN